MRKPILLLFVFMLFAQKVSCADLPVNLSAKSAVLTEASTGDMLYQKNEHDRLPPASVTKIMTMLLTMEAIDSGKCKLQDMVQTSAFAASMGGSQVYLKENEEMSVDDMLKAVAVASGNDAAAALAEFIAGSHENFVLQMNARAAQLGMKNTNFVNCNGLDDPNHLTTAADIAIMSRELLKYEKIQDYTKLWMDSLRGGTFGLVNTNKLIRFYPGAIGLKTGSTSQAGFCVSAAATRDDMTLIAVVMGASTSKERFADATKLLNYGFANYTIFHGSDTNELPLTVQIQKGKESVLTVTPQNDNGVLIEKSKQNAVTQTVTLPESVIAPINKGDVVGEMIYAIDNEPISRIPLLATTNVEKSGLFFTMQNLFNYITHES